MGSDFPLTMALVLTNCIFIGVVFEGLGFWKFLIIGHQQSIIIIVMGGLLE
jgi:hypothetical protein